MEVMITNKKMSNIKTMLTNELNIVLFSKYRLTLMGIAILGVLSGHFFTLSGIVPSNIITLLLSKIYILVFTQGFLFLSGFGLYFSYSKNSSTIDFYKRRLFRVLVPYIILTTPYFIYVDFFVNQPDLLKFIGHITTLGYWVVGTSNGLWYIAVSIALYAIYPLAHKAVFYKKDSFSCVLLSWGILMAIISSLNFYLIRYQHEFYSAHDLGIDQYSIFFVGMLTGYILQSKKIKYQLTLVVFFVLSFVLQRILPELNFLYDPMKKVCIFMPLICIFFYLLEDKVKLINWLKIILDWMGKYTLELYILHSIIYRFLVQLEIANLNSAVSISLAIVISLAFCQPIHLLIDKIVNRLKFTTSHS